MRRKRTICVITILIAVLLIIHNKNHLERKEVSSSKAEINVRNIRNDEQTQKVLWNNLKYYFYDESKNGIVSYSEKGDEEMVLETNGKMTISGNENYLFFIKKHL